MRSVFFVLLCGLLLVSRAHADFSAPPVIDLAGRIVDSNGIPADAVTDSFIPPIAPIASPYTKTDVAGVSGTPPYASATTSFGVDVLNPGTGGTFNANFDLSNTVAGATTDQTDYPVESDTQTGGNVLFTLTTPGVLNLSYDLVASKYGRTSIDLYYEPGGSEVSPEIIQNGTGELVSTATVDLGAGSYLLTINPDAGDRSFNHDGGVSDSTLTYGEPSVPTDVPSEVNSASVSVQISSVPEPAATAFIAGGLMLGTLRRTRRCVPQPIAR